MIELGRKKGHPWHGICRSSTITLPNGATMPVPGVAPLDGDAYRVAIPGTPAVSNDAGDVAAGRTWLNYAMMSGKNHVLYGKALGATSWIYVDSNNKPWRATYSLAGNVLTVSLATFGRFVGAHETHAATVSLTLPGGTVLQLEDIDSPGRQVALSARQMINDIYGGWDWPVPKALWLLTLSGPGTALVLSLAQHDAGTEINVTTSNTATQIYWLRSPEGAITGPFDPPITVPQEYQYALSNKSGVAQYHSERVVGATLHGDVFRLVKAITHRHEALTVIHDLDSLFDVADVPLQPDANRNYWLVRSTNESVLTAYVALSINEHITQLDITQHVQGEQPFGPYSSIEPLVIAGVTVSSDPGDSFEGYTWPFIGELRIHDVRLGNRAYGIQAFSQVGGQHLWLGAAGPASSEISPTWTNKAPYLSASVHPASGELVTSVPENICWV